MLKGFQNIVIINNNWAIVLFGIFIALIFVSIMNKVFKIEQIELPLKFLAFFVFSVQLIYDIGLGGTIEEIFLIVIIHLLLFYISKYKVPTKKHQNKKNKELEENNK